MSNTKDIVKGHSDQQGRNNANTVSKAAITLPAVSVLEQKENSEEDADLLQFKSIPGKISDSAAPDPIKPTQFKSNGKATSNQTIDGTQAFKPVQLFGDENNNAPVQMTKVSIKGVNFGQTGIYNSSGTKVAGVKKGVEIDIDEGTKISPGGKPLAKITSGETNINWKKEGALLNNPDDLWISITRYSKAGEEADEEADEEEGELPTADMDIMGQEVQVGAEGVSTEIGGAEVSIGKDGLTITLFGQELKIGKDSAKLSGNYEKEFSISPMEGIGFNLQIPLPAPAPVYAEIGIEPTLEMSLKFAGAYAAEKTATQKTFNIEGGISGSAKIGITVKAGVGVGLANVVGISGGIFGTASAGFEAEGKLSGKVVNDNGKPWSSSALNLDLSASADLVGKAGAYIQATIPGYSRTKKFGFLEKKFGLFEYERKREVKKIGVSARDLMPTLADFKNLLVPESAVKDSEENDWNDTTPLLGGSARS